MATMTAATGLPWGRPLVRDDLDRVPDDGHRYELLDGSLLVSPAPRLCHQRAAFRLARLLDDACPSDLEVVVAPFDVVLGADTALLPDLLVARRELAPDGAYEEVARVTGGDTARLSRPYAVDVVPSDLVGDRGG
jgi:hypothetical protein